ncbi:MAG: hypothetical protein QOG65_3862, partial [Actinomycetota bacterium]|nr:hypothetical protein [Actinomycetota bacterium]
LFPLMSGDSDEPVYVYQGRMLTHGHTTLSAAMHAEFFHPWLFGRHGSRLFSQYQPGWPAVIALGHMLGDERVALAVAAIAAVVATWFLAQEIAPGSGGFAAVVLVLSPMFVVDAGLYLSYLWSAALVAGGLAGVLAGARTNRPAPFCLSGALFGVAFLSRPFDAVIVAVVAAGYIVTVRWRDGPGTRVAVLWTAAGALPFLVLTALYNAHVTGNPFRFPLQAASRLDAFGFGTRAMAPGQPPLDYTPRAALSALVRNVGAVPLWFAGSGVGIVLAIAAVVMHRRRRETWVLVATIVVFPVGYFFWWATSLAASGAFTGLGPHYYVPAFVPLAVLAGWALRDLLRRSFALATIGMAAVIVGSLFMVPTILDNAHGTTALQRAKLAPFISARLTNAVVVMRTEPPRYSFMLSGFPFLVDDPDRSGRVLYATDRGPGSADIVRRFPSRRLFQLVQRTEPGHALLQPSYVVEPLRIVTGPQVRLRFAATNVGPQPFVVATVTVDGRTVSTRTLATDSHAGATTQFDVVLGRGPVRLTSSARPTLVAAVTRDGEVRVDVGFGPDARRDHADVYERAYFVSRTVAGLAVQTPGLHYHRFVVDKVVWVRQNVGEHLAERP